MRKTPTRAPGISKRIEERTGSGIFQKHHKSYEGLYIQECRKGRVHLGKPQIVQFGHKYMTIISTNGLYLLLFSLVSPFLPVT